MRLETLLSISHKHSLYTFWGEFVFSIEISLIFLWILLSHNEVHNCNNLIICILFDITSCLCAIRTLVTPDLITNSPYGSQAHRRLFVRRIKYFIRRHKWSNSVLRDGKTNRNVMSICILSLVTNSVKKRKQLVNSPLHGVFSYGYSWD